MVVMEKETLIENRHGHKWKVRRDRCGRFVKFIERENEIEK